MGEAVKPIVIAPIEEEETPYLSQMPAPDIHHKVSNNLSSARNNNKNIPGPPYPWQQYPVDWTVPGLPAPYGHQPYPMNPHVFFPPYSHFHRHPGMPPPPPPLFNKDQQSAMNNNPFMADAIQDSSPRRLLQYCQSLQPQHLFDNNNNTGHQQYLNKTRDFSPRHQASLPKLPIFNSSSSSPPDLIEQLRNLDNGAGDTFGYPNKSVYNVPITDRQLTNVIKEKFSNGTDSRKSFPSGMVQRNSQQQMFQPDFVMGRECVSNGHLHRKPDCVQFTEIDGVNLPCVMRSGYTFVSVRLVERKFLIHFPQTYPEEIKQHPPLKSLPLLQEEIDELDQINKNSNYEFGRCSFRNDLIVSLEEFKRFYFSVKSVFAKHKNKGSSSSALERILRETREKQSNSKVEQNETNTCATVSGGWLQINNTVVPYVIRSCGRCVPICVIKYAAGLNLTDGDDFPPTEQECWYLNKICEDAGLHVSFHTGSNLKMLSSIIHTSDKRLVMTELPSVDPFMHASYNARFDRDKAVLKARPPDILQSPASQIQSKSPSSSVSSNKSNCYLQIESCEAQNHTSEQNQTSSAKRDNPKLLGGCKDNANKYLQVDMFSSKRLETSNTVKKSPASVDKNQSGSRKALYDHFVKKYSKGGKDLQNSTHTAVTVSPKMFNTTNGSDRQSSPMVRV